MTVSQNFGRGNVKSSTKGFVSQQGEHYATGGGGRGKANCRLLCIHANKTGWLCVLCAALMKQCEKSAEKQDGCA